VARLHALVVAFVVGVATPAAAELIPLPLTKATITLGAEWKPIAAPGLVAAYRTAGGLVLAITRAQVPNIDAWRAKTREAYADAIERGVTSRIPGYRRIARALRDIEGVPALDLEARRTDGATLVIRILLFRTYALALAIEAPRKADAVTARAIATTFVIPAPAP